MIIEVGESRLHDCLEVIHLGFATVAVEFGLAPENCPTNGAFMPLERLQNDFAKGHRMFAIEENGKPVAFMQLSGDGGGAVEMEKLAVLPQCRHKGYGKTLIAFAKRKAVQLGARKITIGIIEENARLKSWYEANGFTHTGQKKFPHLPFTVGFMECLL